MPGAIAGLRFPAMEDTWAVRELPVLDAAVSQLDKLSKTGSFPDVGDIAAITGLDDLDVAAALDALEGSYIEFQRTAGDPSAWFVTRATSAARRAVGQWPTGESLIGQLAAGIREAAKDEPDPARKRRLQAVARELGGAAKTIAVSVATQILEHQLPH